MMNNSETIFSYIQQFPGRDDDEISRDLRIPARQTVNQTCRRLERQGKIRRASGPVGKIANYPVTDNAAFRPSPIVSPRPNDLAKPSNKILRGVFALQDLGPDRLSLTQIVLRHCLFADPGTVAAFAGAVFPSIRDQKNRVTIGEVDGRHVLLDDNVTPRWAFLWAHGLKATHAFSGWTFAHVWAASKDPDAYTHLANLCMMPEFFGSLSDKQGPLCAYLRYHSWQRYGWRHGKGSLPKPEGYDALQWRYLPAIADPISFVRKRLEALDNQRVRLLRSLTER
jgi:hypothetical protein